MDHDAELVAEMTPLIADLAVGGQGAVALAGSHGKGRADANSDYDFRVYASAYRGPDLQRTSQWAQFETARLRWESLGSRIDGIWMRSYAGVDRDLAAWIGGAPAVKEFDWTIWGYQLPTDLANQRIISDPAGKLADWKAQLAVYPEPLRAALLDRHLGILCYWAEDNHYLSKIARGDLVFLAGLGGKLVNAILQTVFALNRVYFPGDGWNLPMAADLPILPRNFISRMEAILTPGPSPDVGPDAWSNQRLNIVAMVRDLETLTAADENRMLQTGVGGGR